MHGRPRRAPKPEDAAAAAIKADKLRSLQSQLLHFHHNKMYYILHSLSISTHYTPIYIYIYIYVYVICYTITESVYMLYDV